MKHQALVTISLGQDGSWKIFCKIRAPFKLEKVLLWNWSENGSLGWGWSLSSDSNSSPRGPSGVSRGSLQRLQWAWGNGVSKRPQSHQRNLAHQLSLPGFSWLYGDLCRSSLEVVRPYTCPCFPSCSRSPGCSLPECVSCCREDVSGVWRIVTRTPLSVNSRHGVRACWSISQNDPCLWKSLSKMRCSVLPQHPWL